MAFTIEITEAAEKEIREAFLCYEEQREKLGSKFEEHVTKAIDDIRKNPFKYQVRYKSIRVQFLKKFPFGVHYVVNEEKILLVAVFHTSLDPENWKQRR